MIKGAPHESAPGALFLVATTLALALDFAMAAATNDPPLPREAVQEIFHERLIELEG